MPCVYCSSASFQNSGMTGIQRKTKLGTIMQSSFCLQTIGPNVKIWHCPLALSPASSGILHHQHCHIGPSFLSFKGLRAGPSRRSIFLAMRAHMTPHEGDIDKNNAKDMVKPAIAAAVVVVCTLGAMCTGWKATAIPSGWFGVGSQRSSDRALAPSKTEVLRDIQIAGPSSMQQEDTRTKVDDDDQPPSPMLGDRDTKSIRALKEIFDRKCDSSTQKSAKVPDVLLETLNEGLRVEKPKWQKYIDQLGKEENLKAATEAIYNEWTKGQLTLDAYNLGLVLIDLLINLGDYKKADQVCRIMETAKPDEPGSPTSDQARKIRRAILDMVSSADAIISEVNDSVKSRRMKDVELVVRKLLESAENGP